MAALQIPEIMTLSDFAQILNKQPKTIYNWRAKGVPLPREIRLPGIKGIRYLRADVLYWLSLYSTEPIAKQNVKRRGRPRKPVPQVGGAA